MRESHGIPPGSPQSTSLLADLRLNLFMHLRLSLRRPDRESAIMQMAFRL
jgi:hypothetical protein